MKHLLAASLLSASTALAFACSSGSATPDGTPTDPGGSSGDGSSGAGSSGAGSSGAGSSGASSGSSGSVDSKLTIFTIVMENHDYAEIVGSSNAPYINSLIASYGLATNYVDSGVHPSLPNYLTMISGAPQYSGGMDVDPTQSPFPVNAQNLGTQLEAAGVAWRSYQESMGSACALAAVTNPAGNYAPKHDPFLYFTDMQASALCTQRNVDYSQFAADLAAGTYRFMWITPNLTDDGHDPQANPVTGLKQSDAWAAKEIPKIMASAAYTNGGVIFLTWDEAEGRSKDSKDQIPMIVISPKMKSAGYKATAAYSHKSYLATVEDLLGLPRLATVKSEASMLEFLK
ncbi:MAG TPA: alkaline phosphatase family protein [Labilithrix sp.]